MELEDTLRSHYGDELNFPDADENPQPSTADADLEQDSKPEVRHSG